MIPNGAIRTFITSTAQGKGVDERTLIKRMHAKFGVQRMPDIVRDRKTGARRKIAHNRPMEVGDEVIEWKSESEAVFEYIRENFHKIKIDEI